MPFEPYKNAKELGIDTTRAFKVVNHSFYFNLGDIIYLIKDDDSTYPCFSKIKNDIYGNGSVSPCFWDRLEYADEVEKVDEEPKFKVGDKVKIIKINELESIIGGRGYDSNGKKYNYNNQKTFIGVCGEIGCVNGKPALEYRIDNDCGGYIRRVFEDEIELVEKKEQINKTNNKTPKATGVKKFMSIITMALKSKESKAFEHFGLGTLEELSIEGRTSFIDFLFSELKEERKAFITKIVEAAEEDKKRK